MDYSTPPSLYRQRDPALIVFVVAALLTLGSIAFTFGWH
jgi:hypothetical protein